MCFGPSAAETQAAQEQQEAAQAQKKREIEERSRQKRDDISIAVEGRTTSRAGGRSGVGRRSLFTSSAGGGGYLGRFNR